MSFPPQPSAGNAATMVPARRERIMTAASEAFAAKESQRMRRAEACVVPPRA
jgi:hypothetical protein